MSDWARGDELSKILSMNLLCAKAVTSTNDIHNIAEVGVKFDVYTDFVGLMGGTGIRECTESELMAQRYMFRRSVSVIYVRHRVYSAFCR